MGNPLPTSGVLYLRGNSLAGWGYCDDDLGTGRNLHGHRVRGRCSALLCRLAEGDHNQAVSISWTCHGFERCCNLRVTYLEVAQGARLNVMAAR